MNGKSQVRMSGQLIFGLIIITLGVLFLLDNLNIVETDRFVRFWPVALIGIGLLRMTQFRNWAGFLGGMVWISFGLLLLLNTLDILDFSFRDLWPLFMILFGVHLLRRSQFSPHRDRNPEDASSTITATAVMGGIARKNNSPVFKGGDATAFMGGVELDLRKAVIDGSEAVIHVFVMWGGVEIQIPEDWSVEILIVPVMAGVEDKSAPPKGDASKRLVLRGTVIMGGVEVKN